MYPTTKYQIRIQKLLRKIYPEPTLIVTEWPTIRNIKGLYSPRIDVAVGPFSEVRRQNCINDYNKLMRKSKVFINALLTFHRDNVIKYRINDIQLDRQPHFSHFDELMYFNRNARCLLAIEVENKVSRKHLLGGAVNACALGRLGILVGWDEKKVKALVKLQAYWDFLKSVGKNTFRTNNLIILSPKQLVKAIG